MEPYCSDFNPDEPRKIVQAEGARSSKSSERKQPLKTLQINQETTNVDDESNFEQESRIKIEDCFDNYQPCPRYGAVVKVTFTRGKSSYGSGYGLTERQTGEGFKSAAPPDCRVTG